MRTALVTGAATGIGLATSTALAERGWRVLGTAFPGQDAGALRSLERAVVIEADLADEASRGALGLAVGREERLDAFISSAGFAVPAPVEGIPADALRAQFEVNTIAPVLLSRALLPGLRAAGGRMVFLGAGQGRTALPFGGPYGASKAALAALTDALRLELEGSGVAVSLLEPGAVRTGILEDSRARGVALVEQLPGELAERYRQRILHTLDQSARAFRRAMPASEVALLILRILSVPNPKPRYLVGRDAFALAALAQLPARWRGRLLARALG